MKSGLGKIILPGLVIVMVLAAGVMAENLRNRKWLGEGRFTIIRLTDMILIESIDPDSKTGIRVKIGQDVEIETLKQRGAWIPKSLVALEAKFGSEWLGDSIADYLGISYTGLWNRLGVWDKLSWWLLAQQTVWTEVDLADTGLVEDRLLADGQKVRVISPLWYQKARELFYASDLAGLEGGEIRVWNTTEYPGLAGKAAAVLESAGLKVIQVGQAEEDIGYCVVRSGDDTDNRRVAGWISRALKCRYQDREEQDNFIDLYLGSGYAEKYIAE